jgi:hypothetical protein
MAGEMYPNSNPEKSVIDSKQLTTNNYITLWRYFRRALCSVRKRLVGTMGTPRG